MAKEYGELHRHGNKNTWAVQVSPEPSRLLLLTDDDGNDLCWESELEALNALASEGWELVGTASDNDSSSPGRVYVRFFVARERPARTVVT